MGKLKYRQQLTPNETNAPDFRSYLMDLVHFEYHVYVPVKVFGRSSFATMRHDESPILTTPLIRQGLPASFTRRNGIAVLVG